MKIYVISLKSSQQRRQDIARQFDHLRLPYHFFDAIAGRNALRHVHHYDEREFLLNCGRPATANEIGCYASHLALWQRCARGAEPFLILEDDAELCSRFKAAMRMLATRIEDHGFVRLSQPIASSSFRIEQADSFEIRHCRRVPLLAVAYMLSPDAAKQLVNAGRVVKEPVDKYLQRFWIHGQVVRELRPPAIALGDSAATSDIGTRLRPSYGPLLWGRRLLRKTENAIRRDWCNVVLLLRFIGRESVPMKAWSRRRPLS